MKLFKKKYRIVKIVDRGYIWSHFNDYEDNGIFDSEDIFAYAVEVKEKLIGQFFPKWRQVGSNYGSYSDALENLLKLIKEDEKWEMCVEAEKHYGKVVYFEK